MTWPTWTCTFSDGAYDLMLKKQWAVVFTWQTAWQNSSMEVTQFTQHPTRSTSQLHSIGPWPTRNISRWKSTHGATYFDDWLVQNGEHTLMYSKHQQRHFLCSSRVLLTSVVSKCPHTSTRCSSEQRLRLVSGCIRSTPTFMLPVVSGIMPPDIRRNKQCLALSRRAEADDQHALHNIVTASTPGWKRLQSRHPFSEHAKQLASDAHGKTNRVWAEGNWEMRWDTTRCRLRTFIQTPSNKPIGHDLAQYSLVCLNRIRTGYGRFNANMNQMGLSPSASCECGATDQTAQHIASECPLHRCKEDLVVLDTAARNWLHDLQCDV